MEGVQNAKNDLVVKEAAMYHADHMITVFIFLSVLCSTAALLTNNSLTYSVITSDLLEAARS